jgi:hypothetical protein
MRNVLAEPSLFSRELADPWRVCVYVTAGGRWIGVARWHPSCGMYTISTHYTHYINTLYTLYQQIWAWRGGIRLAACRVFLCLCEVCASLRLSPYSLSLFLSLSISPSPSHFHSHSPSHSHSHSPCPLPRRTCSRLLLRLSSLSHTHSLFHALDPSLISRSRFLRATNTHTHTHTFRAQRCWKNAG